MHPIQVIEPSPASQSEPICVPLIKGFRWMKVAFVSCQDFLQAHPSLDIMSALILLLVATLAAPMWAAPGYLVHHTPLVSSSSSYSSQSQSSVVHSAAPAPAPLLHAAPLVYSAAVPASYVSHAVLPASSHLSYAAVPVVKPAAFVPSYYIS
ncbi:hypothetical protein LSTR_LSTR007444 [Laodelphax striatellus]|uniref:Uncharacterized protein n=1 Tax=Laodelphax striatellus TaxID=195883 RepID=A0A482X377_LAOST|nr:hypothetical protein LSTR_LSTR007444 [Laodelphax striatellus]